VTAEVSNSSISGYGQRIRSDHPNPHTAGHSTSFIIGRLVTGLLRDRPADDDRYVDVRFDKLMADPISAVRTIYQRAGLTLSAETLEKMEAYVETNRQVRHKPNEYTAEDFGIDVPALRATVAGYYDRFGVEPDLRFK